MNYLITIHMFKITTDYKKLSVNQMNVVIYEFGEILKNKMDKELQFKVLI